MSTPTGLLATYATEGVVTNQFSFGWDAAEGEFVGYSRTRTVDTTRYVFDTLEHAKTYLASVRTKTATSKTDGVARRINDAGWAECFVVTTSWTDWQKEGGNT